MSFIKIINAGEQYSVNNVDGKSWTYCKSLVLEMMILSCKLELFSYVIETDVHIVVIIKVTVHIIHITVACFGSLSQSAVSSNTEQTIET